MPDIRVRFHVAHLTRVIARAMNLERSSSKPWRTKLEGQISPLASEVAAAGAKVAILPPGWVSSVDIAPGPSGTSGLKMSIQFSHFGALVPWQLCDASNLALATTLVMAKGTNPKAPEFALTFAKGSEVDLNASWHLVRATNNLAESVSLSALKSPQPQPPGIGIVSSVAKVMSQASAVAQQVKLTSAQSLPLSIQHLLRRGAAAPLAITSPEQLHASFKTGSPIEQLPIENAVDLGAAGGPQRWLQKAASVGVNGDVVSVTATMLAQFAEKGGAPLPKLQGIVPTSSSMEAILPAFKLSPNEIEVTISAFAIAVLARRQIAPLVADGAFGADTTVGQVDVKLIAPADMQLILSGTHKLGLASVQFAIKYTAQLTAASLGGVVAKVTEATVTPQNNKATAAVAASLQAVANLLSSGLDSCVHGLINESLQFSSISVVDGHLSLAVALGGNDASLDLTKPWHTAQPALDLGLQVLDPTFGEAISVKGMKSAPKLPAGFIGWATVPAWKVERMLTNPSVYVKAATAAKMLPPAKGWEAILACKSLPWYDNEVNKQMASKAWGNSLWVQESMFLADVGLAVSLANNFVALGPLLGMEELKGALKECGLSKKVGPLAGNPGLKTGFTGLSEVAKAWATEFEALSQADQIAVAEFGKGNSWQMAVIQASVMVALHSNLLMLSEADELPAEFGELATAIASMKDTLKKEIKDAGGPSLPQQIGTHAIFVVKVALAQIFLDSLTYFVEPKGGELVASLADLPTGVPEWDDSKEPPPQDKGFLQTGVPPDWARKWWMSPDAKHPNERA